MTAASFRSKLGFTQPAAERPTPAPQPPAPQPPAAAPAPQPIAHQEGTQFDRMGRLGERVGEQNGLPRKPPQRDAEPAR